MCIRDRLLGIAKERESLFQEEVEEIILRIRENISFSIAEKLFAYEMCIRDRNRVRMSRRSSSGLFRMVSPMRVRSIRYGTHGSIRSRCASGSVDIRLVMSA